MAGALPTRPRAAAAPTRGRAARARRRSSCEAPPRPDRASRRCRSSDRGPSPSRRPCRRRPLTQGPARRGRFPRGSGAPSQATLPEALQAFPLRFELRVALLALGSGFVEGGFGLSELRAGALDERSGSPLDIVRPLGGGLGAADGGLCLAELLGVGGGLLGLLGL